MNRRKFFSGIAGAIAAVVTVPFVKKKWDWKQPSVEGWWRGETRGVMMETIPGQHGHCIIVDDPLNPRTLTMEETENLKRALAEHHAGLHRYMVFSGMKVTKL